jgi:hypothetical protein
MSGRGQPACPRVYKYNRKLDNKLTAPPIKKGACFETEKAKLNLSTVIWPSGGLWQICRLICPPV